MISRLPVNLSLIYVSPIRRNFLFDRFRGKTGSLPIWRIQDMFKSVFVSEKLGGIVLKSEQEEAVLSLLSGKDVFAVLPDRIW